MHPAKSDGPAGVEGGREEEVLPHGSWAAGREPGNGGAREEEVLPHGSWPAGQQPGIGGLLNRMGTRELRTAWFSALRRPTERFVPEKGHLGLPPLRRWAIVLVKNRAFEQLCKVLIVSNAIFLGIEVELHSPGYQGGSQEGHRNLRVAGHVYLACFALEVAIRLTAHGLRFFYGPDWGWHWLDLALLLEMVAELALGEVSFASVSRTARLLRISRLMRIIRVMQFFRGLRITMIAILSTFRQLLWTMVLIGLIIYAFGICMVHAAMAEQEPAAGGDASLGGYFGSVPRSMFTLFMAVTGGIDWGKITTALETVHPIFTVIFLFYVYLMLFVVLNVIAGIVYGTAIEAAMKDEDTVIDERLMHKQEHVAQLRRLFNNMSIDSEELTLSQLESHMESPEVQAYFLALDIEVNDAWSLFKLLDRDRSEVVDFDEFVEGCLSLKGHAKSIDIALMRYENQWMMNKLAQLWAAFEARGAPATSLRSSRRPSEPPCGL